MSDDFYRAFEERYRGSRELIKSRLNAYLPFVRPLAELDPGAKTIDLGCGRGEWLELMAEIGLKPHGIDLDEGMLSGCVELGLSVEKGDATAFLATLPSESQVVVSAFHFVEHISFEQLRTVVSEALRVLKPGGLLIMETPNPENIVVATCNFYLDPTHQRPIPPQLLSFLPEYHGFARTKTIRLQESKDIMQSTSLTLHNVLDGVSPDYAAIAQKAAAADVFCRIDPAFEDEYGLNLATLAGRYDTQLGTNGAKAGQAQQAEAKAEHAEAQAQQAQAKAEHAEAQAQQAQAKAEHAEAQAQQAQAQSRQAEAKLQTIYASRSWRITRPLRQVNLILTTAVKKLTLFWILKPLIKLVYAPRIIARVKRWSMKYPNVQMKLIGLRNRIISRSSSNEISSSADKNDITAHILMQLVKSKLASNPQAENVLYLKEPGANE